MQKNSLTSSENNTYKDATNAVFRSKFINLNSRNTIFKERTNALSLQDNSES